MDGDKYIGIILVCHITTGLQFLDVAGLCAFRRHFFICIPRHEHGCPLSHQQPSGLIGHPECHAFFHDPRRTDSTGIIAAMTSIQGDFSAFKSGDRRNVLIRLIGRLRLGLLIWLRSIIRRLINWRDNCRFICRLHRYLFGWLVHWLIVRQTDGSL